MDKVTRASFEYIINSYNQAHLFNSDKTLKQYSMISLETYY